MLVHLSVDWLEMCIGDQQYITLLFYLDDICVFAETVDQMLDRIQLVFNRLKEFSLKIKPKKSHFFQAEVDFRGHVLSKNGVSPNPEKIEKVHDWPTPTNSKEVPFLYRTGFLLQEVHSELHKMGWASPCANHPSFNTIQGPNGSPKKKRLTGV